MGLFTDALMLARRTLDDAGYKLTRIDLLLDESEVRYAQREEEVARAIVEEALRPRLPYRPNCRPLAEVHGVRLYVWEGASDAPPSAQG